MMKRLLGLLVLPLLTLACDAADVPMQATIGDPVTIGLNRTLVVDGNKLVTPIRVTEDSRCPAPLMCYWQGQVVVEFKVVEGGEQRTISVSTLTKNDAPPQIGDIHLAITDVTPPARLAGTPMPSSTEREAIAPEDYRFTLLFSRVTAVSTPVAGLNVPVDVPEGQTVTHADGLAVTFQQIVDDSRCPKNPLVLCESLGEVTIQVRVDNNGRIETGELKLPGLTNDVDAYPNVPDRPGATASLAGVNLRLLAVEPQQTTLERPVAPSPSTATIVITR